MPETDEITIPVLIALTALPQMLAWRQNSGLLYTLTGRRVRAGINGCADIIGCYRGRFVTIETKTKRGKLSEDQERFRDAVYRAGGIYIVARSVDEAVVKLQAAMGPVG